MGNHKRTVISYCNMRNQIQTKMTEPAFSTKYKSTYVQGGERKAEKKSHCSKFIITIILLSISVIGSNILHDHSNILHNSSMPKRFQTMALFFKLHFNLSYRFTHHF